MDGCLEASSLEDYMTFMVVERRRNMCVYVCMCVCVCVCACVCTSSQTYIIT